MASDAIRKKWGTIFMGERESTMEELDAMYEPQRQEQARQEREEDYLERVRLKATDKARQILGEAYTERQNVLDEARTEAAITRRTAQEEAEQIRAAAIAMKNEAAAALAQAQAEREAAIRIREAAHGEGFQEGMEQAGEELREFRHELGQSLAVLLRAMESQLEGICMAWREDLADVTCAAVAAGTSWVLDVEREEILRSLLFEALKLLEDRLSVVVRVHPDDEAAVSDMFAAARERMPDLKQWVVNGDPNMMRGGLVAESGSGSVDCRRELFLDMVRSILTHLAIGSREGELPEVTPADVVEREGARMAVLAPEPASLLVPESSATARQASAVPSAPELPEDVSAGLDAEISPEILANLPPDDIIADGNLPPVMPSPSDELVENPHMSSAVNAPDFEGGPDMASDGYATASVPVVPSAESESTAEEMQPENLSESGEMLPEAWLPPLGEDDSLMDEDGMVGEHGQHSAAGNASTVAPSLAELEEELFPLGDAPDAENVFADGGFLPPATKGPRQS